MASYTTVSRISSLLQYREPDGSGNLTNLTFDSGTIPTNTEVESLIDEVEDVVDKYTESSWKSNSVTNEYHDFIGYNTTSTGAYYDKAGNTVFEIRLKNRPLRTMSAGSGHKIEVWDGNNWYDFIASATLGSAYGEEDYYIDYQNSKIFLFNEFPIEGKQMIRITYDYGDTTVPNGIRLATTWLVGAWINERYELYSSGDKDASPPMRLAERWEEKAYKLLDEYRFSDLEVI